jgi:malonyl-CoA decarboxylase
MFESFRSSGRGVVRRERKVKRLIDACWQLLSEEGEASGTTRAKETLALYEELDADDQAQFFDALKLEFSPDANAVLAAAQAYAQDRSSANLATLSHVAEPPRQELLRRLNRAPGGTRAIVNMRARLLDLLRRDAELAQVDDDFRHLLSSWFNPGFLGLKRVDWNAPAALLEQIIHHEAVHAIRDWNDLRRRLQQDRRCFAFFHPAMPDEPLVFVEVALVSEMASEIDSLIATDEINNNADAFRTAVFYSISNCQHGLRGVSLGNFLIKHVVTTLTEEFPQLREFCTLSPIPGFREWLKLRIQQGFSGISNSKKRVPEKARDALASVTRALAAQSNPSVSDLKSLNNLSEKLQRELTTLCAAYLLGVDAEDNRSVDPVARFHLNNGARLDRLNWNADHSDKGVKQSFGLMVNYVYEPKRIERNHEQYVRGKTVASRAVEGLL